MKAFCPEEEEEGQLTLTARPHDRLGRPVDEESEEEQLELMGDRGRRYTEVEASYEKRRTNKADIRYLGKLSTISSVCMMSLNHRFLGLHSCIPLDLFISFPREKRENPAGFTREGRRLRVLTKNEEAEFATGLIIG